MPVLVEQHVLRLDVTVDVSGAVDRVQRLPELCRDTGGVGGAQRLRSAYCRLEIVAGHVAHDEVRLAVGNSDVMDGTTLGCSTAAAARASVRKRLRLSGSSMNGGAITLTATSRSRSSWRAR